MEGIGGVQNQTRTVDIDYEDQDRYRLAGSIWFSAAVEALGDALSPENRPLTFAAAPAVWCAIGAIGHDALEALRDEDGSQFPSQEHLREAFARLARDRLSQFDWRRADHWLAMGAKRSASGAVTLGGPKEAGSLIYKDLKGEPTQVASSAEEG